MHVKQANAVDLIQDAIQIHGVDCLIRRSFERLFLRRRNGNSGGCFRALWGFRFLPDMVLLRLGPLVFGIPLDFRLRPDGIFPGGWFSGRRMLYDRLNPAEHLTASLTDGLSQLSDDRDRVEVRNVPEVLGFKIFLGAQAAAGHEGIGDTGGGESLERQTDVQLVQLFQKTTLSCGQNILPILVVPCQTYRRIRFLQRSYSTQAMVSGLWAKTMACSKNSCLYTRPTVTRNSVQIR